MLTAFILIIYLLYIIQRTNLLDGFKGKDMHHLTFVASHGKSMIERTFFLKYHIHPRYHVPNMGLHIYVCVCVSMYIANILWLVELIGFSLKEIDWIFKK